MGLESLLQQTVQIRHRTGVSYTGDPEYGEPVTYAARISYRNKRVFTAGGGERASTAHITALAEVGDADLVILPDGTERVPLAVKRTYSKMGVFHHSSIDL